MPTTIAIATYYTASARAVRTKQDLILNQTVGDEITVNAGQWHGHDEEYPAWSEHKAEKFVTLEAARSYVRELPRQMYNFEVNPETVEFFKVVTVTHTTHETVKIDG